MQELAGFGHGLPLSRTYARYWGGDIVVSLRLSMRQHTSAYVSICQHASAYVNLSVAHTRVTGVAILL
jgi:hypothetical protein